jgi:isopenicillin-N epimerase
MNQSQQNSHHVPSKYSTSLKIKREFLCPIAMPNSTFAQFWLLDPTVTFLNHGSFGACPIPVLEHQQALRQQLERQPLLFLGREIESRLDAARSHLATFLQADPANLVFVPNATTGVNAVLRSFPFQPGDAVLTTNQEYNACRNALNFVAEKLGLEILVAHILYPIADPQQAIDAILTAITPNTKLALIDHVVSQTGLVLPIETIIAALNDRGIQTLIDGAHAPGMLPLNLQNLDATYYSGNLHKWVCSPKGAAFLYVASNQIDAIHPTTISHGRNDPRTGRSRFHLEFDWTGTGDPTAYLSVPKAIELMGSLLPGGWDELMQHNRTQAIAARNHLAQELQLPLPCPESMIGSLATLPLSDGDYFQLQTQLWEEYRIEVPIVPFPSSQQRILRISSQIYNHPQEYEYLAKVLKTLLV